MDAYDELLASFLLDAGLLSRAQLADVQARAAESNQSLAHTLPAVGALGEDEVRRATAQVLGVPFVTLSAGQILPEALAALPEPLSRLHGIVAYNILKERGAGGRRVLEVALLDLEALAHAEQMGLPYVLRPRLTDRASLTRALLLYQQTLKEAFGAQVSSVPSDAAGESAALDVLLERALYSHAHAVYLVPTEAGYLLRYGLGGGLYDAMTLPRAVGEQVLSQLALRAPTGSFKIMAGGQEVRVAVEVAPALLGQVATLHVVPAASGRVGHSLASVGLHGQALADMRLALQRRRGLVLVAGQSKATQPFLYALADTAGGYAHTVHSVEASLLGHLPFAVQTLAGGAHDTPTATAVRGALLHEPDILLILDISDRETALLALEAANRGVLVLAGISSAPSAVAGLQKLLSFGASPSLLASALLAAVGTARVRALCPCCAGDGEVLRLSRSEMVSLEEAIDFARVLAALKTEDLFAQESLWRDVSFVGPVGCAQCHGGYAGYLGLCEVVPHTLTLRDAIAAVGREGASGAGLDILFDAVAAEGMLNLLEDGMYKAATQQTSVQEVLSLEA